MKALIGNFALIAVLLCFSNTTAHEHDSNDPLDKILSDHWAEANKEQIFFSQRSRYLSYER